MIHHNKLEYLVKKLHCCLCHSQCHSDGSELVLNVCPDSILWTIKCFVAKHSMVKHHEVVSCKEIVLLSSRSGSQCRLV